MKPITPAPRLNFKAVVFAKDQPQYMPLPANICEPYFQGVTRSRARKHKLPFDITPNDIFIPAVCPVLGIVLQRGKGRFAPNSPSLDRFIPEKGYVRGNIVVISYQANLIKTNSTPAQVMQVAHWMRAVVARAL